MTDILLLLLSSTLGLIVGKYFEKALHKKEILYNDLYRFATALKLNVAYKKLPLEDFIKEYQDQALAECFYQVLCGDFSRVKLSKSDKVELRAFIDGLSAQNSQMLVKHLDYYETVFGNQLNSAKSDYKTKGGICCKIGILMGITLGLMLI